MLAFRRADLVDGNEPVTKMGKKSVNHKNKIKKYVILKLLDENFFTKSFTNSVALV